jgi:hypothetical protein
MSRGWWKEHWFKVVFLTFCSGIALAIAWPAFAKAKTGGGPWSCGSNFRLLGRAFGVYQVDNDGRMPLEEWMTATRRHSMTDHCYTCQELRWEKKKFGYAYNSGIVGADTSAVKDPETTVVLFETEVLAANLVMNLAGRDSLRHRKITYVSFLDSHVKRFPAGAPLK